ncbi:unnamed protein product [Notodromas monacha]|uniref:3'-phosphate/5'-hydroxy nucleic acid ligase n=1 Tax=Notodromas monacha TaxID=399045 RepID=A0A7R9BBY0_9CRUS|nr:unnamed protein product [Notodromas monacha]CAG0912435.1 unnamed protein product [Notodromas monacha]
MAAFDMDDPKSVVSPGGVGFDINCGVRLLRTNLTEKVHWPDRAVVVADDDDDDDKDDGLDYEIRCAALTRVIPSRLMKLSRRQLDS